MDPNGGAVHSLHENEDGTVLIKVENSEPETKSTSVVEEFEIIDELVIEKDEENCDCDSDAVDSAALMLFKEEVKTEVKTEDEETLRDPAEYSVTDEVDPLGGKVPLEDQLIDNLAYQDHLTWKHPDEASGVGPSLSNPTAADRLKLTRHDNLCRTAKKRRSSRLKTAIPDAQPSLKMRRAGGSGESSILASDEAVPFVENPDSCCIVDRLVGFPLRENQYFEQAVQWIVREGRPRNFVPPILGESVFQKYVWITACSSLQKIFCWYCLLYGDKSNWRKGREFRYYEHLINSANIHELTLEHKLCAAEMECQELFTPPATFPVPAQSEIGYVLAGPRKSWAQPDPDEVRKLLQTPFLDPLLSDSYRDEVVAKGRHCSPKLRLDEEIVKNLKSIYAEVEWLCSSDFLNRFFCWPCLLFVPGEVWSPNRIRSVFGLQLAVEEHQVTQAHIEACLQLKVWAATSEASKSQAAEMKRESNSREDRFFKHVIDMVLYAMSRRNNYQYTTSHYWELLCLMGQVDAELEAFLAEHQFTSSKQSPQLVDRSVAEVCAVLYQRMIDHIQKEISGAVYVSIILESVATIRADSHVALVVRFVNKAGDFTERLVALNPLGPLMANRLVSIVFDVEQILKRFNCLDKTVIYSVTGFRLNTKHFRSLKAKMKRICPSARFFPPNDEKGSNLRHYLGLLDILDVDQLQVEFHRHQDKLAADFPELDTCKLLTQLTVVRRNSRLSDKPWEEILRSIDRFGMTDVLGELAKFCRLALIFPTMTESESTPKVLMVNDYVLQTKKNDTFGPMDVIFYVEKDLLSAISSEPDFHKSVAHQIRKKNDDCSAPMPTAPGPVVLSNSAAELNYL